MSFWSSEKIKEVTAKTPLVEPYDEKAVAHGAYELGLGPEAFLTSDDENKKTVLDEGEQLVIPPGQFCLLLTEEKVFIPNNAIGLISIKAGVKFRGLINVSGFHVDSGFQGRLKFSVYNAGSQNIVLQRKQRVFLLWFCDLDRATSDTYKGTRINQSEISTEDVMRMQGEIASPWTAQKGNPRGANQRSIIKLDASEYWLPLYLDSSFYFCAATYSRQATQPSLHR